ncbi:mTOR complex interacting protein DEP [Acrasis kona]|uniref:MTOR complex interacting protein DEP n=1 Tax=Acrasis kona TaxID=1008807 RepID=A0AAW2YUI9_9EUKA
MSDPIASPTKSCNDQIDYYLCSTNQYHKISTSGKNSIMVNTYHYVSSTESLQRNKSTSTSQQSFYYRYMLYNPTLSNFESRGMIQFKSSAEYLWNKLDYLICGEHQDLTFELHNRSLQFHLIPTDRRPDYFNLAGNSSAVNLGPNSPQQNSLASLLGVHNDDHNNHLKIDLESRLKGFKDLIDTMTRRNFKIPAGEEGIDIYTCPIDQLNDQEAYHQSALKATQDPNVNSNGPPRTRPRKKVTKLEHVRTGGNQASSSTTLTSSASANSLSSAMNNTSSVSNNAASNNIGAADDGRYEWMHMHHKRTYHPLECFVFTLRWIVCAGVHVDDYYLALQRRARQYGFALIQTPIDLKYFIKPTRQVRRNAYFQQQNQQTEEKRLQEMGTLISERSFKDGSKFNDDLNPFRSFVCIRLHTAEAVEQVKNKMIEHPFFFLPEYVPVKYCKRFVHESGCIVLQFYPNHTLVWVDNPFHSDLKLLSMVRPAELLSKLQRLCEPYQITPEAIQTMDGAGGASAGLSSSKTEQQSASYNGLSEMREEKDERMQNNELTRMMDDMAQ